jgi:hypothetical protein
MPNSMEMALWESKRTSRLIDNLVLLARADSDEEVLKPGPVPANSLLHEAVIPVPRLRSGWVDESIRAWNRGDDRCGCGHRLSLLRNGDGPGRYFGLAYAVREEIRSYSSARPAGSRDADPSAGPWRPRESGCSAHIYLEQRAVCHGVAGKEKTAVAKGEFPRPAHLFIDKVVTDDDRGETYGKGAQTVSGSGMPGFH